MQNQTSKVSLHCGRVRKELRSKNKDRDKWLKDKYINKSGAKDILPEKLELFKDCKIFITKFDMALEEIMGVEIVTMEGE